MKAKLSQRKCGAYKSRLVEDRFVQGCFGSISRGFLRFVNGWAKLWGCIPFHFSTCEWASCAASDEEPYFSGLYF